MHNAKQLPASFLKWPILTLLCLSPLPAAPAETQGPARPNILLICVDDLRPELGCYGAEHILSPNIDDLARRGCRFNHHYVQAPTCGASRYALLTGQYGPAGNDALFQRAQRLAKAPEQVPPSMPEWFRSHGYQTVAVGKVSHHPGGLGGNDWNDPSVVEIPGAWDRQLPPASAWQHPRGAMHGLAHGEIRVRDGEMDVFQSAPGDDSIYPDGLILEQSLDELDRLSEPSQQQPFLLAVGFIRPHLPFGAPAQYYEPYRNVQLPPIPHPQKPAGRTTWHGSGEFMKYQRWQRNPNNDPEFADLVRKHYAACVSYSDALVGRLLQRLDQQGLRDNTVIVLWGDHGWHLGEHAIWGKHSLFEESLRSPLIICCPSGAGEGKVCNAIVESIDVFPTICELSNIPVPEFCHGTTRVPLLNHPDAAAKTAAISYSGNRSTIRTDTHRLVRHADGYTELYDHTSPEGETVNVAAKHPELVGDLSKTLQMKLELRTTAK